MKYTVKWLQEQIKELESNIAGLKKAGKDYAFEERILKNWKTYLPGGRNHYKLGETPPNQNLTR